MLLGCSLSSGFSCVDMLTKVANSRRRGVASSPFSFNDFFDGLVSVSTPTGDKALSHLPYQDVTWVAVVSRRFIVSLEMFVYLVRS